MRADQSYLLWNDATADSAAQMLDVGGNHVLDVCGDFTSSANVVLQRLGPDGVTWLNAATAVTANAISAVLGLIPGSYRMHIVSGSTTGLYARLTRVPTE